jgi:hypothetical protein
MGCATRRHIATAFSSRAWFALPMLPADLKIAPGQVSEISPRKEKREREADEAYGIKDSISYHATEQRHRRVEHIPNQDAGSKAVSRPFFPSRESLLSQKDCKDAHSGDRRAPSSIYPTLEIDYRRCHLVAWPEHLVNGFVERHKERMLIEEHHEQPEYNHRNTRHQQPVSPECKVYHALRLPSSEMTQLQMVEAAQIVRLGPHPNIALAILATAHTCCPTSSAVQPCPWNARQVVVTDDGYRRLAWPLAVRKR